MRDMLGKGTILGYCTNVHAGNTLDEIKRQLQIHAVAVKDIVSPKQPMGVGLWFPASVAYELAEHESLLLGFRDWLNDRGLQSFTINGFPYGDFHHDVVKHDVYLPNWSHAERVQYTHCLAHILHALLPEGEEGSISTLPIGWRDEVEPGWADAIGEVIDELSELYRQTGRVIHLDIEPEPGCEIDSVESLFMWLIAFHIHEEDQESFRRHLRICLDTCHQAVMFERPTRLLEWVRQSEFKIGKVQFSSALSAKFRGRSAGEKAALRAELERFVEPRYLHQTTIGGQEGHRLKAFHDDLPLALKAHRRCGDEWRVHFHVPVFLDKVGSLDTTQRHIIEFFKALQPGDGIRHFEVETYAWNVLPQELQVPDLAEGIARELLWVKEQAAAMIR